jgi:hypothetical protein
MTKFSIFIATALLSTGAYAQNADLMRGEEPVRAEMHKAAKAHKTVPARRAIAGPGENDQIIKKTPEGKKTDMYKIGFAYGYSYYYGFTGTSMNGAVSSVVVNDDEKKVYIQNPIFYNFGSEKSWIVGDLDENNVVTFTFPQLIDLYEYEGDDEEEASVDYDYAVVMQLKEDGTERGWYYARENQTYRFQMNEDGSLVSLEGEDIMIGLANWIEETTEGKEPYWTWMSNGDIIESLNPITDEVVEVPEDVKMDEWKLINTTSARSVYIGVQDDKMYIRGLFNKPGMKDASVVGTIDGDKVTFATNQYLGYYSAGTTLAYFNAVEVDKVEMEGTETVVLVPIDSITFAYDKVKNTLSSDQAFSISYWKVDSPYYSYENQPYFSMPSEGGEIITSLSTPEFVRFYEATDYYPAQFAFNIQVVSPDRQILDTKNLYYEAFLDDELYVFYDDEYALPKGTTEMSEVPYGYYSYNNTTKTYDFDSYGNEHSFYCKANGFTSLGVRTLYKNTDGTTVYSDILWAPGYEGKYDAVESVVADGEVASVAYYDLNGRQVVAPANGIFVKRITFADGSVKSVKVALSK